MGKVAKTLKVAVAGAIGFVVWLFRAVFRFFM